MSSTLLRRAGSVAAVLALLLVTSSSLAVTYTPEARPFSPTSFFNRQIPAGQAADPNSSAMVAELDRQVAQYGSFMATDAYSAPIYTVSSTQPRVPVILDNSNQTLKSQFAAGVPLPTAARGAAGTDGEAIVWQPSTDTYWEFWRLVKKTDGFHASYGGIIQNASQAGGTYTNGTGTAASGLALMGGMIRPGEFGSWTINHVLSLGVPNVTAGVIRAPATRTDGSYVGGGLPMGTRFQIDPSINVFALNIPNQDKILAYAAQRYGMVITDSSGMVAFYGEDPLTMLANPWPTLFSNLSTAWILRSFPWDKLRALPPTAS